MCVNHCGLTCDRGGLLTDAEDVWSGGLKDDLSYVLHVNESDLSTGFN